jgi:hypothetical protein
VFLYAKAGSKYEHKMEIREPNNTKKIKKKDKN